MTVEWFCALCEQALQAFQLTSSAGLDEKHLWLVLQQRTMCIVKGFEDPVQLKVGNIDVLAHVIALNVMLMVQNHKSRH